MSVYWHAVVHRTLGGAVAYTDLHPGNVIREFPMPRDFSDNPGSQTAIGKLSHWNPDGIISFCNNEDLDLLRHSLPATLPIVSVDNAEFQPNLAVVVGNFVTQAKMVIRHFREQGVRSMRVIAFEKEADFPKKAGWFSRLSQTANPEESGFFHEVRPVSVVKDCYSSVEPVPRRLADWLHRLPKPSGIFTSEPGGGGYLIRVCHALGLRVPQDIQVVGCDEADVCLACSPTLTSAFPNGKQVGFEAMATLARMMAGHPAPAGRVLVGSIDLQVRESTGLKRAELCNIAAALDYIDERACHGLSVQQLVKDTQKVSLMTFYKSFFAATGKTPGEAIQQRQHEAARQLLAQTELSISRIAEYCGFTDSSDFSRRFRALAGATPSEYRKRNNTKKAG